MSYLDNMEASVENMAASVENMAASVDSLWGQINLIDKKLVNKNTKRDGK